MLALPPQRRRDDGRKTAEEEEVEEEEEEFLVGSDEYHQFIDFGDGNLLDCIDFGDLFVEVEGEGELVPGLEMVDCDIAAEVSAVSGRKELEMNVSESEVAERAGNGASANGQDEDKDKSVSRRNESGPVDMVGTKGADRGGGGGKKSSSLQSKISPPQGKRKAKVDWTPDLHRRFVQAVEQLGLDKAVPSKILEIMGIECLTRHNIASHLQKYRSHRKHLLAREAEAASWNHQRRQMYNGGNAELSPWLSCGHTMGFPPPASSCPLPLPLRHLHVWGHPSADRSAWPKRAIHQLPPALHPRPPWQAVALPYPLPPLLAPPVDPSSCWNPHHHQVPSAVTPGTPCFPQPKAFTGLVPGPPAPGIPPSAMYKVETSNGVLTDRSGSQPPPDFHPSKETIDAAIGDALAKPWQPLPLGLKPPSLDGVLTELHRQGIPNIPPSSPS